MRVGLSDGTTELTGGAVLPIKGIHGGDITWSCSDNSVIGSDMTIIAPAARTYILYRLRKRLIPILMCQIVL